MFGYQDYNVNGSILGLGKLSLTGVSKSKAGWFLLGVLLLNVALLFGAAWLFQLFWAWFTPAVVPMLPHVISYWHAFASVCLMLVFMPRSGKS